MKFILKLQQALLEQAFGKGTALAVPPEPNEITGL